MYFCHRTHHFELMLKMISYSLVLCVARLDSNLCLQIFLLESSHYLLQDFQTQQQSYQNVEVWQGLSLGSPSLYYL